MPNTNAARPTTQHRYLRTYFQHHQHAWQQGLRQLTKTPIASILTIAAISITLVLPTVLLILLNNMKTITQTWQTGTNISVYLNMTTTTQQVAEFRQALQKIDNIKTQRYISPTQGLQQFTKQSGLPDILKTLNKNPLPGVFMVEPGTSSPAKLNILAAQLKTLPYVKNVKLDEQWVKRLNAIINLLQRFTYGIATLLALAVLLIVGNTIRMAIQNYHREIEVMKLIGGSDRFIRRPFLYSGIFYGLSSAIFAAIILNFLLIWLQAPINQLTALYNTQFSLQGLTLKQTGLLILVGILLGFGGSWFTVNRHLRHIQPE